MNNKHPEAGLVEITPEVMQRIADDLKERFADIAERYPKLVDACPYEMRLAVTANVMRKIVEHANDGGSFRYLIYERLGFDVDAYVPLHEAGGMTISNEFTITKPSADDLALARRLIDLLWPKGARSADVRLEGGTEPWLTICAAAARLEDLSVALAAEQEKRARAEQEQKAAP